MNRTSAVALAAVLALSVLGTGCVTVPKEAPELSAALGDQIQQTRAAHVAAVRMYFDEKRAAVDRFVADVWLPQFVQAFFDQPSVQQAWVQTASSTDASARVDFIRTLGPKLQAKIDAKYAELRKPLDEMEAAVLRALDDHYNGMLAANAALTGLLRANEEASTSPKSMVASLTGAGGPLVPLDKVEEVTRLVTAGVDSAQQNEARIRELVHAVGGR
jgi:hypothetical protein